MDIGHLIGFLVGALIVGLALYYYYTNDIAALLAAAEKAKREAIDAQFLADSKSARADLVVAEALYKRQDAKLQADAIQAQKDAVAAQQAADAATQKAAVAEAVAVQKQADIAAQQAAIATQKQIDLITLNAAISAQKIADMDNLKLNFGQKYGITNANFPNLQFVAGLSGPFPFLQRGKDPSTNTCLNSANNKVELCSTVPIPNQVFYHNITTSGIQNGLGNCLSDGLLSQADADVSEWSGFNWGPCNGNNQQQIFNYNPITQQWSNPYRQNVVLEGDATGLYYRHPQNGKSNQMWMTR